MLYSELRSRTSKSMVTDRFCRHFGVSWQAARKYLINYDPNITTVAQLHPESDEWSQVLRNVLWGDMTDEEIQAACA